MRYSTQIRSVEFLQAKGDEPMKQIAEVGPIVIVQDGEAKAVIQDVLSFERTEH